MHQGQQKAKKRYNKTQDFYHYLKSVHYLEGVPWAKTQHLNRSTEAETLPASSAASSPDPIIGLHIRHGDVCVVNSTRRSCDPLSRYMKEVDRIYDKYGWNQIYLATDDPSVLEEAPRVYPNYTWHFIADRTGMHQEELQKMKLEKIYTSIRGKEKRKIKASLGIANRTDEKAAVKTDKGSADKADKDGSRKGGRKLWQRLYLFANPKSWNQIFLYRKHIRVGSSSPSSAGTDANKGGMDNVGGREILRLFMTTYVDLYLISLCDALVGKFSSSLDRLALLLMAARTNQLPPYISLDSAWYGNYGGVREPPLCPRERGGGGEEKKKKTTTTSTIMVLKDD